MNTQEMCETCEFAEMDYCEYYGGHKQWFMDGCRKGLYPVYNEEEECKECEGYKEIRTIGGAIC